MERNIKKPVSVVFVDSNLSPFGGVPTSCRYLISALNPSVVRMSLFSLRPLQPSSLQVFRDCGTEIAHGGNWIVPQYAKLTSFLFSKRPDVVCCTSLRPFALAKALELPLGHSTVFWNRGIPVSWTSGTRQAIYRTLTRNSPVFYNSMATLATNRYEKHTAPDIVIYNGVPEATALATEHNARQQARARLEIGEGEFVIGYVASYAEWKDHKTLLECLALITRERHDIRLVLVGGGSIAQVDAVRKMTSSFGAAVIMTGEVTDPRNLLPAFDVYIHPAYAEAFGNAVAEAMMAELPVICARAGALPELILDGESGLLFTPGSAADLADKVEYLHGRPDTRQALARKARERANQLFSATAFARRFEEAIQCVLSH